MDALFGIRVHRSHASGAPDGVLGMHSSGACSAVHLNAVYPRSGHIRGATAPPRTLAG